MPEISPAAALDADNEIARLARRFEGAEVSWVWDSADPHRLHLVAEYDGAQVGRATSTLAGALALAGHLREVLG